MNGKGLTYNEGTPEKCPKCDGEFPRVRLLPYKHQVSGHHRVMLFNDETICKTINEQRI